MKKEKSWESVELNINLSILDFKSNRGTLLSVILKYINLSILDFKS